MHPFVSEDKSERKGKRNKFHAISLCDSGAAITGIVNDLGMEHIFSEQLKSVDGPEGIEAFTSKRKPEFKGK